MAFQSRELLPGHPPDRYADVFGRAEGDEGEAEEGFQKAAG